MTNVIHTHLCVDIKTRTQKTIMHPGDNRKGMLSMTDEDHFEFVEQTTESYVRNPTVFEGEYINVHCNKYGELVVTLRKTELFNRKTAVRDGEGIKTELVTAAKMLGL